MADAVYREMGLREYIDHLPDMHRAKREAYIGEPEGDT